MKIYLDTADVAQIKKYHKLGIVDGVTTNPTIISREGRDFEEVVKEIASIVDGPVSAEVVSLEAEGMIKEAKELAQWAENVVIKIPMTADGLEAVSHLTSLGIKTNVTLVFTMGQALLAAKAGATYISPFVGRLEDIGTDSIAMIRDTREMLDFYGYDSEIISASIRTPKQYEDSVRAGAHIGTIPPALIDKALSHPLTDSGIEDFIADWEAFIK